MAKLHSVNPHTYETLGEVDISTEAEIINRVTAAQGAQQAWFELGLSERIARLRNVFEEALTRKSEIVEIQNKEMGMPHHRAAKNFDDNIQRANWYFENAEKYLAPEITYEDEKEVHAVYYEPIGVVAVIVPWNFPFANFVWGTVQNLLIGNTVVLKHSEECPLSGKLLEEIYQHHLPPGVFGQVYGDGSVGQLLLEQNINGITFTGSTKVGKHIFELAGKRFIKSVMELGGSAPGIVFDDADIATTVAKIAEARLNNCGQACSGLKRLIVQEGIYLNLIDALKQKFLDFTPSVVGDVVLEMGPLVAKRQLDLLVSQVEDALGKGAECVVGGNSLEEKLGGAFFEPTLLKRVTAGMRVWQEEVFGPVLPVISFKTEEEAIQMANDTPYGLGGYVFSRDLVKAERVARRIQTGQVSINNTGWQRACNPFGGSKASGFGRQHGKWGFQEMVNIKVITRNK